MQVKEVMATTPLSVRGDATIQEAAAGMRDSGVGALPVVDRQDQLVGIVTDRDMVVRALGDGNGPETQVEQVMTKRLFYVDATAEVEDALAVMQNMQIRRLPVIDDRRLVGILAQADIAAVTKPKRAAETLRSVSEPAASQAELRSSSG